MRYDSVFILLPPFLALLVVLLLPPAYRQSTAIPLAAWVIVVLCMDVGHVYSTLFRTYFDPERFYRQRALYIAIPLLCYAAGVVLYMIGGWVFWRVLAYVAVFHFIRQQYGFMRLYSRQERASKSSRLIDAFCIYSATLYPLIFWHLSPDRRFSWFMEGDFLQWNSPLILRISTGCYIAILCAYVVKELYAVYKGKPINIPRNGIIIGTAISWYFGIIFFNGDFAFTLLNVVSHGIPYVALVWTTSRLGRSVDNPPNRLNRLLLRWYGACVFLSIILLAAWLEEGFWDHWVWGGEHGTVFRPFSVLPALPSEELLLWLVPLLALPQATHYVLDGFIWRRKDG